MHEQAKLTAPGDRGVPAEVTDDSPGGTGGEPPADEGAALAPETVGRTTDKAGFTPDGGGPTAGSVGPTAVRFSSAAEGASPAAEGELPTTGGASSAVDGEPPTADSASPSVDGGPPTTHGAGPAPHGDVSDMWPATARTVPRARRKLVDALDGWGLNHLVGTASLVLSELVTNAVTHTHVPGRLVQTRFVRTDRGVRLEVHDASNALPIKQRASDDAEDGRGLALVEALTGPECWGYGSRKGVGKLVWAYVEPRPDDDSHDGGGPAPA